MDRPGENDKGGKRAARRWHTALKVAGWTVGGVVGLVCLLLVGAVTMLRPDRLTPLVGDAANRMLNADVSVARVELSLRGSFPFLNIDVDSLTVMSRDVRALPPLARDTLPSWADTLLTVDHLHGGINVFRLVTGVVLLNNVEITRPGINVLVVNDTLNNFSIAPLTDTPSDTTKTTLPDIRLNRFSLVQPRPIRYIDMGQDISVSATIQSATLTNNGRGHGFVPQYLIDFKSNVSSPLLKAIGRESMQVGLDGIVEWRHDYPYSVALRDFRFSVSGISGKIDTRIDFTSQMTVEAFDFGFDPTPVASIIDLVPDSLARSYGIPEDFDTDAVLHFSGSLERPYIVGNAQLPHATLQFSVPPCRMRWEALNLQRLKIDAQADLRGGGIDDILVRIKEINLQGPATDLTVRGNVAELGTDPLFDGEIDGSMRLEHLPSAITDRIPATLRGKVTANTSAIVRPSMFTRNSFHRLRLVGDVDVEGFYYLADDTLAMYYLNSTKLHFGTNERFKGVRGVTRDSLLAATLAVDSADMLVSGLDIRVNNLKLGIGARNTASSTDTTLVIPMGGGLSVGNFSLFSLSDTAGIRMRDVKGQVSMRRYKDDARLPLFTLNLGIGNISAGNNHTRFVVSNSGLACNLGKLPVSELTEPRRQVRHIADSLHRVHPQLPVDSVYVMALEIRNRNRRPGHHRVHRELTKSEAEIIEWGTSSTLRRLLLDWDVRGSLKASAARLFTPRFAVRNRVENFNLQFANDSITLTDVKYKAGKSDFLISGRVSNLKKALTSRRTYSPLRLHFDILSDFIDINELSHAFFTGQAHSGASIGNEYADERTLERNVDAVAAATDSIAALLIPTNIDAELKMRANSVAYSDFILKDFSGTVLMYDGALNLHDLQAASDVGSIDLTALYSAPSAEDIDFGFGMKLKDFNIHNFIKLVPAVDTIMPMLRDLSGIVSANLALTSRVSSNMDLVLPSVKAAINIEGDSLSFIDPETFHKVAKWLLFKDKEKNMIDHLSAEMIVDDGRMQVFPFIFDFDRYRLGIQGYNDFDMNLNYHIAVLKSPIPFKFGINVKGSYDKLKIRLGGARFNEKTPLERSPMVDDTRVNLLSQFQDVFRRGVRNSRFAAIDISGKPLAEEINLDTDTLTGADSAFFREQGLIP